MTEPATTTTRRLVAEEAGKPWCAICVKTSGTITSAVTAVFGTDVCAMHVGRGFQMGTPGAQRDDPHAPAAQAEASLPGTTDLTEMVEWLRREIERDRAEGGSSARGQHYSIARHDPRDVIADCEAKLAIIDLHASDGGHECPAGNESGDVYVDYERVCLTLRHLARAYRHRDGYKASWTA